MKDTTFASILLLSGSALAHSARQSFPSRYYPRRQASNTQRTTAYDFNSDTQELLISGNCTNGEIRTFINSWAEAGYLSEAMTAWKGSSASPYDEAFNTYMGTDAPQVADRLTGNIQRDYALHTGNNQPPSTHFFMYCNSAPSDSDTCKGSTYAAVWAEQGTVETNQFMITCPLFYDDSKTPSLAEIVRRVESGEKPADDIESYQPTKASTILHESFHYNFTVGQPMIYDYVPPNETTIYGAESVANSAKYNNAEGNSQIAEAYEDTGVATWAMQIFGLAQPPTVQAKSATQKRQDPGEGEDTTGAPVGFITPSNPDTAITDFTVYDWNEGIAGDQQPDIHAWYRISGSLATINAADYQPKNLRSNSTSSNSTLPTPIGGSNTPKPTPIGGSSTPNPTPVGSGPGSNPYGGNPYSPVGGSSGSGSGSGSSSSGSGSSSGSSGSSGSGSSGSGQPGSGSSSSGSSGSSGSQSSGSSGSSSSPGGTGSSSGGSGAQGSGSSSGGKGNGQGSGSSGSTGGSGSGSNGSQGSGSGSSSGGKSNGQGAGAGAGSCMGATTTVTITAAAPTVTVTASTSKPSGGSGAASSGSSGNSGTASSGSNGSGPSGSKPSPRPSPSPMGYSLGQGKAYPSIKKARYAQSS